MSDLSNTSFEIPVLRFSNNNGDKQDFLIVKEFRAFGLDVIAIYPCDENLVAFEDAEYEILYKDSESNVIFSDGKLYEKLYNEFRKTLQ